MICGRVWFFPWTEPKAGKPPSQRGEMVITAQSTIPEVRKDWITSAPPSTITRFIPSTLKQPNTWMISR